MGNGIKNTIRSRRGFTLAETMLAVLILVMVSAVVAAGIPAAVNALDKVTSASNADLLLSTAMTSLRDELGTAKDVTVDGTTITYSSYDGGRSKLYLDGSGTGPIMLRQYMEVVPDESDPTYERQLVSEAAANNMSDTGRPVAENRRLIVSYTVTAPSLTDPAYLTFDIQVKRGGRTVAEASDFTVRILANS